MKTIHAEATVPPAGQEYAPARVFQFPSPENTERPLSAGRSDACSAEWSRIYERLTQDVGDPEAYAALRRRVARWANRQLSSPPALRELHEDVVEDTCAATIMNINHAYGSATFGGFVYGHFLSVRRRYLRFVRTDTVNVEDVELITWNELGPDSDELSLLEHCLLQLSPRERRAVELRYFREASAREISEQLGVTETNARRIVFNGLHRLRQNAQRLWPCGREG